MNIQPVFRGAMIATSLFLISNYFNFSNAQNIGINATGATPNASAGLDVDFTNKGFLAPRVALTAANVAAPITSPANSLLIFNTATAGLGINAVTPGYYFWDGVKWSRFSTDGENWKITGNSNIGAGNFLGTTNAQNLILGTNSTAAAFITADGRTAAGIGAYVSTQLSVNAGAPNNTALIASTPFAGAAVQGQTTNANGRAILGIFDGGPGTGSAGVFGSNLATATSHTVVVQNAGLGRTISINSTSATNPEKAFFSNQAGLGTGAVSVWGQSQGESGGVFLANLQSNASVGLKGQYIALGAFDGIGVSGISNATAGFGYGVIGQGNKFGVFANGNLGASGTKSFIIDHPLDPENKYLKHYSIESPEVLNLYRGTIQLDENGEAEINLPDYFSAININFSYQLTAIGSSMPNLYISKEIENGKFKISGGVNAKKVAWIVYAERNDEFVKQNPNSNKVEVVKDAHEKGKYLLPTLYGQGEEKGMFGKHEEMVPVETIDIKAKEIDVEISTKE